MAMLIIPFLLVYHILIFSKVKAMKTILFACLLEFAIIVVIKKFISKESSYEIELYQQIINSPDIIKNLFEVYSFKYFAGGFNLNSNFIQLYFIPLLCLISSIIYFVIQKKYWLGAFLITGNIGLWLVIVILFNRGDGNMFMEKNFAPWILIALFPLIDIRANRKLKNYSIVFIAIYSLNSILGIIKASQPYTYRYHLIEKILLAESKIKQNKIIIQDSLVNHDIWLGTWALPYETLLMGKVMKIPNSSIRIYKNEEIINKELNRTDLFLGADFIPPLPATYLLNQKYFKLSEQKYKELTIKTW
jgi:hypothetical protein